MHKYWYTILLSFSLFIAAAAAMIGGVLMKPEAGKTVKQDFAASAAVRDPAFPVSAALSSTLPETLRPSDSLKALPLPAPPESPNVIKIRKYHYIRTDMSIKHICFFMQKTLDKPAPKCGEAP